MTEPKTLAEFLDAARNGQEFGAVINRLFTILENADDGDGDEAA
jgi:hypothetical protein